MLTDIYTVYEYSLFYKMGSVVEEIKSYATIYNLIFIFVLSYFFHWILFRRRNLPPGPIGFPILGCLPFVRKNTAIKFHELGKKYDGIFSMYLGTRYAVILTDHQLIKEALNSPAMLAHPPDMPLDILDDSKYSKTGFVGRHWLEQRRVILHTLRNLGLGKNTMEERIKEEISYLLEEIKKLEGKAFSPRDLISSSVSNNICYLVFGRRFSHGSPDRELIDECQEKISKFATKTFIHVFIPQLKPLLRVFGFFQFATAKEAALKFKQFIAKELEEHKKTFDKNNIRDFIDGYLLELEKRKDDDEDASYFNVDMLFRLTEALIEAGTTTLRETLSWAGLIMAEYPMVQKRVQHEIDEVIGRQRKPSWADHPKMPYTQAVIMEVLRWRSIIATNFFRYCQATVTLRGYDIPKGSLILTNNWSIHNDDNYWKDPDVFRPERFLDETGAEIIRHDQYMPFSIGKMSCPGESLAKTELFLYFTSILQHFTIRAPQCEVLDLKGTLNLVYMVTPQKLCFLERV